MTQNQGVFQRYEKKYLLNRQQLSGLKDCLCTKMTEEQYGLYSICNLYFDTEDYALIRASIEKPIYKEKIRLRSYGVPGPHDTVFLELKKKYKGIVYKRRISLTLQEAEQYLQSGELPEHAGQIFREIGWAMRFYHHPTPKVFIGYDRVAYFGNKDSNLRITFDRDIRWRGSQLDLAKGDWGSRILDPELTLMEIKIPGVMPLWLSDALSKLQIFTVSFSKYGTCYQQEIFKKSGKTMGGIICA